VTEGVLYFNPERGAARFQLPVTVGRLVVEAVQFGEKSLRLTVRWRPPASFKGKIAPEDTKHREGSPPDFLYNPPVRSNSRLRPATVWAVLAG